MLYRDAGWPGTDGKYADMELDVRQQNAVGSQALASEEAVTRSAHSVLRLICSPSPAP